MIPARNEHAQDFLVNDEFLLSVPRAFTQCTRSLKATVTWYFQSVWVQ